MQISTFCLSTLRAKKEFRMEEFFKTVNFIVKLQPKHKIWHQKNHAFQLIKYIMEPYLGVNPRESIERIFNYRLSRAGRFVENVFEIISSVFRKNTPPPGAKKSTNKSYGKVCLHNYLKKVRLLKIFIFHLEPEKQGRLTLENWRNSHNVD